VAQDHRSPGAKVVDIAVSIGICKPCALSAFDEGRRAATARKARTGEFTPPERSARRVVAKPGNECGWEGNSGTHNGFSIEGRRAEGQVALWRVWSFIERCQRIAFLPFISGSEPQD